MGCIMKTYFLSIQMHCPSISLSSSTEKGKKEGMITFQYSSSFGMTPSSPQSFPFCFLPDFVLLLKICLTVANRKQLQDRNTAKAEIQ